MARAKVRTGALRDLIVDHALLLLEEGGPPAVRARGVASAAGTSTAAVYELFGDKAGLVRSVFFEGFRLLERRLRAVPETSDARADLVETLAEARRFALDRPMLFEVMYARPFAEFEPSADDLRAGVGLYRLVVGRVQAWGASAGATPIADDPRDAAHAVVATNRGLVATELAGLAGTSSRSVERRWRLTIDALLDGLASDAGRTGTGGPRASGASTGRRPARATGHGRGGTGTGGRSARGAGAGKGRGT
jgi:AcrR family transcriptional regulator